VFSIVFCFSYFSLAVLAPRASYFLLQPQKVTKKGRPTSFALWVPEFGRIANVPALMRHPKWEPRVFMRGAAVVAAFSGYSFLLQKKSNSPVGRDPQCQKIRNATCYKKGAKQKISRKYVEF